MVTKLSLEKEDAVNNETKAIIELVKLYGEETVSYHDYFEPHRQKRIAEIKAYFSTVKETK